MWYLCMRKLNFIDLFSGAGGLSEGFINAGFNPIAHVEIDKSASKTIETRLIYHNLKSVNKLDYYYDYLRDDITRDKFVNKFGSPELTSSVLNLAISKDNSDLIFRQIDLLAKDKEVDVIVGGPPCQAYSLVGRSRDLNRMRNDPRNYLYKEYAKFLKNYKPKVFVFENVVGLKTAKNGMYLKNMLAYFRRIGYNVQFEEQNSQDFGVLQTRRRIIIIGWRKDLNHAYPELNKETNNHTVNEILQDLIPLKPGDDLKVSKYKSETTRYLSKHAIRNGADFVTQHIARPHNSRDLSIYKIAIENWERNRRLKYSELPDHLKTHKNQSSFLDRFKVVNGNGLSHTMVAHIAKDGHHYIYPSIEQIRSISVREAARIQSFADDFYFEGGRTAAFRQIGNAVPPLMAKEIAKKILEKL